MDPDRAWVGIWCNPFSDLDMDVFCAVVNITVPDGGDDEFLALAMAAWD